MPPPVKTFKALYVFQALEADELSLVVGDLVDVTVPVQGEWGHGTNRRTQVSGSFPWSYVELLKATSKPHKMAIFNISKPAFCSHCADFIWGSGRQMVFKCTECDFYCHKNCKHFVENNTALDCARTNKSSSSAALASAAAPVSTWTVDDVRVWLAVVNLQEYETLFADRGVTGQVLQTLNPRGLQELGVIDPTHVMIIDGCISELVAGNARLMDGDFTRRCQTSQTLRGDLFRELDELKFSTPDDALQLQLIKGHHFKVKTYLNACWCDACRKYMWGLVRQGLQCTTCGYNTHRMCLDEVPHCIPTLSVKALQPVPPGASRGFLNGGQLESATVGSAVPRLVAALLAALDDRALDTPQLYLAPPDPVKAKALLEVVLRGADTKPLNGHDPQALAWLLRRYFAQLPDSLIPAERFNEVMRDCLGQSSPAAQITALDALVARLPAPNQVVLAALLAHLGKVLLRRAANKVETAALSAAWASVLLRPLDEVLPATASLAPNRALAVTLLITKCKCGGIPGVQDDAPPPIVPRNKKPSSSSAGASGSQLYENLASIRPTPTPRPPPRPAATPASLAPAVKTVSLDGFAWYAGPMERSGADLALQNKIDGSFLIRKSNSHSGYSLSVKYREIRHILIVCNGGKFGFSDPATFESLPDLISHFQKTSLAAYNAELETKLEYPYKTAPQMAANAADDADMDDGLDEDIYMSNRDALRTALGQQAQTEVRRTDVYSSRIIELQRRHKAQEAVCIMLREQKKLLEAHLPNLSDADRKAVTTHSSALFGRLTAAEDECAAIAREMDAEKKKEREAERAERAASSAGASAPPTPNARFSVLGAPGTPAATAAAAAAAVGGAPGRGGGGAVKAVPSPESSTYYVGLISRQEAEKTLDGLADGTFLIRKSDRQDDPYTISMRFHNETKHIQIKSSPHPTTGQLHFGLADPPPFPSLDDLVAYYKKEALSLTISIPLILAIKQ